MLWGLGESSNTAEQPPARCPELDPPGSGAKKKAGQGRREEQVGGSGQRTKATQGEHYVRRQENWVLALALLLNA